MKLKELESRLQTVKTFERPKLFLEQYITTSHLASQIVFNIDQLYDDLKEKNICDLGCGTGMLSIACSFMEPDYILGIDIDTDALKTCQENIESFDINNIDLIQCDCDKILQAHAKSEKRSSFRLFNRFDTVIMNPPFGTKNFAKKEKNNQEREENDELSSLGMDLKFLKLASLMTNGSIYSIHKSVTRDFIERKCKKWNLKMEVVSELKYDIPKIDSRNRRMEKEASLKDVYVDLIRFTKDE